MTTVRRLAWAVHLVALALWASAIAAGAIAAMNVFPTMDDLAIALTDHADYPADLHGRLAASRIMEGVFVTGDLLQVVAAALALVTLVVQLALAGAARTRPAQIVRTAAILVATGLLAWHVVALAPPMYGELRAWWTAAGDGRTDDAERHRQAFNTMHPTAERLQGATLLLVVIALAGAGWTLPGTAPRPGSPLETPTLARSR